ncbi:CPBP family intramembrane glutamic endopeptidase [Fictibacillus phosphorivorans]|uniref:CPBP family intramembrane glutamic endopeptidase n=1 Tax=Fictibacillus phosphorivorans TaxID=1221500 RepID=UPI001293B7C6|nr:CPBP family intramembrane glutamic endopeptidase [Fictibacillus phosphorivorans]MQR97034.1 CPBP family intramembrane metalloprotease [Fictibacillus phosphorivorans]
MNVTTERKWTIRELILLLSLCLVGVPILLENILYDQLIHWLDNTLYAGTLTGFCMAIVFTTAVYWIALKPNQLGWRAVGLNPLRKKMWKTILLWTILLILISIALVVVMDVLSIGTNNAKTDSLKSDLTPFTFVIGFLSAAVVSPIYEEIFYRGFLYTWFRRWGVRRAMIYSSFIFMIVHIPTYNTLPVNFASGLVFCWVYEKTGSIIPAIIIHGIVNGIGISLSVLA